MWTRWKCETCGKEKYVRHRRDADVYTVVNAIRTAHQKVSPACAAEQGLAMVKADGAATPTPGGNR